MIYTPTFCFAFHPNQVKEGPTEQVMYALHMYMSVCWCGHGIDLHVHGSSLTCVFVCIYISVA